MALADTSGQGAGYGAALRVPLVRQLWTATAVSQLGDYVGTAALLVLAAERSGGLVIGPAALFAARGLPALLTSALAGSWLDGVRRDRAMVALQVLGAVGVLLPLAVPTLTAVYVAGAWLGVINAVHISVRAGAMAEGVPDLHRGPLIALNNSTDQTSQVVGFAAGGALAVVGGPSPALMVDAASFVVSALVLTRLRLPRPERRNARPPVLAGIRDILANPVLRLLGPLVWVTATVGAIPEALARSVSPEGSGWYPLVLAAGPAGQAVAMLVVGRLRELARPSFQLVHLAWLALALGIASLGTSPVAFAVSNLLVGSGVAWTIGPQLTFLRQAPPARMAQITATMLAVIIAAEGLGALALGALADATSPAGAYRGAGLLVLVAAVIGWIAKERSPQLAELDHGEATQAKH